MDDNTFRERLLERLRQIDISLFFIGLALLMHGCLTAPK